MQALRIGHDIRWWDDGSLAWPDPATEQMGRGLFGITEGAHAGSARAGRIAQRVGRAVMHRLTDAFGEADEGEDYKRYRDFMREVAGEVLRRYAVRQINRADWACVGDFALASARMVPTPAIEEHARSDAEALDCIAAALHGREWNADTVDIVADAVRSTARAVGDVSDDGGPRW